MTFSTNSSACFVSIMPLHVGAKSQRISFPFVDIHEPSLNPVLMYLTILHHSNTRICHPLYSYLANTLHNIYHKTEWSRYLALFHPTDWSTNDRHRNYFNMPSYWADICQILCLKPTLYLLVDQSLLSKLLAAYLLQPQTLQQRSSHR